MLRLLVLLAICAPALLQAQTSMSECLTAEWSGPSDRLSCEATCQYTVIRIDLRTCVVSALETCAQAPDVEACVDAAALTLQSAVPDLRAKLPTRAFFEAAGFNEATSVFLAINAAYGSGLQGTACERDLVALAPVLGSETCALHPDLEAATSARALALWRDVSEGQR